MASTSFQVIVDEYGNNVPNHQFTMIIDKPMDRLTKNASNIRDFIYKLNTALDNSNKVDGMFKIRLNAIEENGPTQSIVRWSNVTISGKRCDQARLKQIYALMVAKLNFVQVGTPAREKVKIAFERIMGPEFHIRKVNKKI